MLSVVTILELERGTLLMERRDAAQGAILRRWLEGEVLATPAARDPEDRYRGRAAVRGTSRA